MGAKVALVLAIIGLTYGLLWLFQTASLSGAPNYPIERARFNANGAYVLLASSLAVAVVAALVLIRGRSKYDG
jgi:hypothetical protein